MRRLILSLALCVPAFAGAQKTAELRQGVTMNVLDSAVHTSAPKTHGISFCRGRWGTVKCAAYGTIIGIAAGAWIGQIVTPKEVMQTGQCAYGMFGPYCSIQCVEHCDVTFTRTWIGAITGGILAGAGGYYLGRVSNR